MYCVDLNSDLGESFGNYTIGMDEEILKYVSSANVACGWHAGDAVVMEKTVAMAGEFNTAVGAHPGFPDLVGFGRRNMAVTPEEAKACHRFAQERGVHFLDAPVSGGEPKAIDGTLSFMVGGKQAVFDRCRDMLLTMGASAVRCGDVGAGNTTKLANQIIVACNIQAVAEAFTLAQKAGVDPELVFRAIRGGLAGSTVLDAKGPMMLAGNDKPGFKIDLHIKDLNNALDCAHAVGAPVPMTAAVQEVLEWLHHHDCGGSDHSAIAKYYAYLTGIQLGR